MSAYQRCGQRLSRRLKDAEGSRSGEPRWNAETRLAARALGSLFVAGATIGLVSLLLPHPPQADVIGLFSNVGLAYAGGVGLLLAASRVRVWALHTALTMGALLITRAVVLSGDAVSFYSVWFIWLGLYAFYRGGRDRHPGSARAPSGQFGGS